MKNNLSILLALFLFAACSPQKTVVEGPRPTNAPSSVGRSDSKVMALFMSASQARILGEGSKAIHLFEEVLKVDPENAAAMFELSKLYNGDQRLEPAVELAEKAAAIDPGNIWYQFLLADLYKQGGQLANAVKVYDRVLDRWPGRYDVYLSKAELLAYMGKQAEADKVFDEIQEQFGWSDELLYQRYTTSMQGGDFDGALSLVEKALQEKPDDIRFLSMKAEALEHKGEMDQAYAVYKRILEQDPSNSNVRIALAEHYYSEGKVDKAVEQLELSFKDPNLSIDSKMQVLLGFFEMTQRPGTNPEESKEMTQRAYSLIELLKEQHPEEGKPYTIHGDFLMRDGRVKEARDQFRLAVNYEKDKFAIWQQLVVLDSRIGTSEELLRDATEAAELFPTQPVFYLFKGVAENQLEKYDDAVETFVTGKNLVVDDNATKAQFLANLGDAYNSAKDYNLSDKAFEDALKLQPEDVGVMNNYSYFLSLRNEKLERAESLSARSNELSPNNPSYQDTYAWILYQSGKYNDARVWIEKAIASGGAGEGVLNEHYGDILFKLGDVQGAVDKWKLAQEQGGGTDLLDKKIAEEKLFE